MARIAISVCGEGRGHASRIATLVESLVEDHDILIYTSGDAISCLRTRLSKQSSRVDIQEIPGIVFQYTNGYLDMMRSVAAGLEYQARQLGPLVDRMIRELEVFGADLAITDFEPALPRAASRKNIPLISVDHQHFLLAYDLDALPWSLQWNAWFMSHAVWLYVAEATDTVVSAFFRPPLRRGWEHVLQVGPLLRSSISHAEPREGGYILSYLRRHTPFSAIEALADCGMPVKVYGLGDRDHVGAVSFHAVDEKNFVEDLIHCSSVIASAGNQLIGESLHLGKPLMVLPERAHAEQMMNGHFLSSMGCGKFIPVEDLAREHVKDFISDENQFKQALAPLVGHLDGTRSVLKVIQHRLNNPWPSATISDGVPSGTELQEASVSSLEHDG